MAECVWRYQHFGCAFMRTHVNMFQLVRCLLLGPRCGYLKGTGKGGECGGGGIYICVYVCVCIGEAVSVCLSVYVGVLTL